jgi:thiol-disulfide isomerase/thioredoxin
MVEGERFPARNAGIVLWLRRVAARALDVAAVLIVLAAVFRFVVAPRLHQAATPAPPVRLATLDGGRFDLAAARGRILFVDFWATWCDPCRDEIPLVQRFARSHPEVAVESVDVGENPALVRPFAAKFRMEGVALDPDQSAAHAFGITGFPTMVAIDPQGRVRARWIGFDPKIEQHMAAAVQAYGVRRAGGRGS